MSESDHCVVVSDQIGYGLHGKVGSSTIIMYFQTTMGGTNTVVICTVWCIIYHIIICSSRVLRRVRNLIISRVKIVRIGYIYSEHNVSGGGIGDSHHYLH